MNSISDFLSFVLYDDMRFLRGYAVNFDSKFVKEHMAAINKFKWSPKSASLHKFARMEIDEALRLRFMTRKDVMHEYEVTEYLAYHYIALSKVLQLACELQLYGLYELYKGDRFILESLVPRYMISVMENCDNKYWQPRFRHMLDVVNA